jgi:hypothetical protein
MRKQSSPGCKKMSPYCKETHSYRRLNTPYLRAYLTQKINVAAYVEIFLGLVVVLALADLEQVYPVANLDISADLVG